MTTEITEIIKGFKQYSENPYKDTINFLKEYLEVEESSEAYFELGKALFFNGDYDESIECLIKSDDYRSDAYLGLDHYRKQEYETAIEHFKKFLRKNTNETVLGYLMLSYEHHNDWKNAIRCGEELLEINPENKSVKMHLIDCHFNYREYERSLEYINELDDRKLRYKKGLVLHKLKRYEEAIAELAGVKSAESYLLIGKTYEKLNKPGKAVRFLMKSYDIDGNIETLFEISEISFKNGNHNHSIQILEDILLEDPKNERALETIAKNYLELQKFELVIEYCEELLKVNADNSNAYLYLSETYHYLHDLERSFECAERGLEINPESAELWIRKAWMHYDMDFEEFKRTYETTFSLEPNNVENFIRLINQCGWSDDLKSAQKYYEKLLFYNPTFTMSLDEIISGVIRLHY